MNQIPAATLQDGEAAAADGLMPGNQNAKLGSRMQVLEQRTLYIQKVVVGVAANVTPVSFAAEVSGEIVDVDAVATAASASGTLTLRRSTTAISSAIVAAVGDVLSRTTSVVQAQKAMVQGETLNIIANGATDRGIVYISILRT